MTTVQQFESLGLLPKHNAYQRRALACNDLIATRSGKCQTLAPPTWAGARVRPTHKHSASTDEKNARADGISKYSRSWLEANALVPWTMPKEYVGRRNTVVDDRPVVYVVDDDIAVRASSEALMGLAGWRCESFTSAEEFLSKPKIAERSCLLLDFNLPDVTGLELQRTLLDHLSEMPIVFLTRHTDVRVAVEAMKRGAIDFLTKPCDDDVLLAAIRKAFDRGQERCDNAHITQAIRERRATLSRREHEVMSLVVTGLLNKQIGFELGISEITVKAHRGQVMRKMGAKSLAGLVTMGGQLGLAAPLS